MRAIEREQQRLQQCINSTKLKETFYEKAFDGYKKKLEAEFGAAIHRVQSLSTDAVASGKYDTAKISQEAAAVMNSFAQASNVTGDFGRAIASDVFAQSSNASVDTLFSAPAPLKLRSFDADKEAAIFELNSGAIDIDNDDNADVFPEIDIPASIQPSTSHISDTRAASNSSATSPRLTPALSFSSLPAQSTSTSAAASSSSTTLPFAAPAPLTAQRPPRPLSPKPSFVKGVQSQDPAAISSRLVASSDPAAVAAAPASLQPSPSSASVDPVITQQNAVRASGSCIVM